MQSLDPTLNLFLDSLCTKNGLKSWNIYPESSGSICVKIRFNGQNGGSLESRTSKEKSQSKTNRNFIRAQRWKENENHETKHLERSQPENTCGLHAIIENPRNCSENFSENDPISSHKSYADLSTVQCSSRNNSVMETSQKELVSQASLTNSSEESVTHSATDREDPNIDTYGYDSIPVQLHPYLAIPKSKLLDVNNSVEQKKDHKILEHPKPKIRTIDPPLVRIDTYQPPVDFEEYMKKYGKPACPTKCCNEGFNSRYDPWCAIGYEHFYLKCRGLKFVDIKEAQKIGRRSDVEFIGPEEDTDPSKTNKKQELNSGNSWKNWKFVDIQEAPKIGRTSAVEFFDPKEDTDPSKTNKKQELNRVNSWKNWKSVFR